MPQTRESFFPCIEWCTATHDPGRPCHAKLFDDGAGRAFGLYCNTTGTYLEAKGFALPCNDAAMILAVLESAWQTIEASVTQQSHPHMTWCAEHRDDGWCTMPLINVPQRQMTLVAKPHGELMVTVQNVRTAPDNKTGIGMIVPAPRAELTLDYYALMVLHLQIAPEISQYLADNDHTSIAAAAGQGGPQS